MDDLSNPLLVRLTYACKRLDAAEILAALEAGASAYEALLMLIGHPALFDLVLTRSTPKDRIRFCAREGAFGAARLRVEAWGRRERLKRLLP
jgi:hypothetical protein